MSERAIRVGEQLRADLMGVILRGRLRDPATQGLVITSVKVSADLQHARVFVRTLEPANDRKQLRLVRGLERAAGFLRREIGKELRLRRTPELHFSWDEAVDRGNRVESILDELARERESRETESETESDEEEIT